MDRIQEIYKKIEKEIAELKEIAIEKMYVDYFSKYRHRKAFVDNAETKEIGMRKLVGDCYYYSILIDQIVSLLDPYISNNNSTNNKVQTWITHCESPIIMPNNPYKRLTHMDIYKIRKDYIDGDYDRLDVFDYKTMLDDYLNDDIEPLLMKDIKKINKILSKINKCKYIGFFVYDEGEYHELFEYKNDIMFEFIAILIEDKLKVLKLEMFGNLYELKEYFK
ncbi:MAG: hypothetical protein K5892_04085 [Acholeplasmatales bacterium]|nr:hypothetical protein [Acholeplasmatales bacterium]